MKTLAVCFHHTHNDIEVWKEFVDYLSDKYKEKFKLVTYESISEEKKRSIKEDYDVVFQNPETTFTFIEKGYEPIARLDNQWDIVYYIAKRDFITSNKLYNVGIVPLKVIYSSLLELKRIGLNLDYINFKNFSNLNEIHSALLSGDIDIGITRKDTFNRMSSKFKNQMKILTEFGMGIFHSFLVQKENGKFKNEIANILLNMDLNKKGKQILYKLGTDKVVKIGYELYFLKRLTDIGEKILEFRNYRNFFTIFNEIPETGILIYGHNIAYANDFALKLLKYEQDEIKKIATSALFSKKKKDIIDDNINKRIQGNFFTSKYEKLKLFDKYRNGTYVAGYASTIIFQGQYKGYLVFWDSSEKIIFENLYNSLKEINNILLNFTDEYEICDKLCEILTDKFHFGFARITYNDGDELIIKEKGKPLINPTDYSEYFNIKRINVKQIQTTPQSNKIVFKLPIFIEKNLIAVVEIHTEKFIKYVDKLKDFVKELQQNITFIFTKLKMHFESNAYFSAISLSKAPFYLTNTKGEIIFCNNALLKIFGYDKDEIIGKTPAIFKSGLLNEKFYQNLYDTISAGKEFNDIFIDKTKDGKLIYLDSTIIPLKKLKKIKGFVCISKDITNEINIKKELKNFKFTDKVTGFFNLSGFNDSVDSYIQLFHKQINAMIIIDVMNMNLLNSRYGYDFGNEILKKIALVISSNVKKKDFVGRIGGDDFAIFLTDIKNEKNIFKIIERLLNKLNTEVIIENKVIKIAYKIAVAMYPIDAKSSVELINKCYLVLSKTRNKGKNLIKFYNHSMEQEAEELIRLDELINSALKEKRFFLQYQPYYLTNNLNISGFEALVRLKLQNGDILYPNSFIDYLESSEYINKFEEWLIEEGAAFIYDCGYGVSVNLTAKNIGINSFVKKIEKIPDYIGQKMTFEITEREVNNNLSFFIDDILKLKNKKMFKFAIDDFGTGYSSLIRLKELPLDILKIDIRFVREMFNSERDKSFVQVILDMGKRFNYYTLAEGVETNAQLDFLKKYGCNFVQGFLLSKPLCKKDIKK